MALAGVAISDDVLGVIGTVTSLAPGETKTVTRTITVTASSPIRNVGTVEGTDPLGRTVKATDDAVISLVLAATEDGPMVQAEVAGAEATGTTPIGGVATGAGGASRRGNPVPLIGAALGSVALVGLVTSRRRRRIV